MKTKMRKEKYLGTKYGVKITRPWNKAMYDHNEKVSEFMKENILKSLDKAYLKENDEDLKTISKSICYYSYADNNGMDEWRDTVYKETIRELDFVANYHLDEEYPWLADKGYVPVLEQGLIGYEK
jgi:hypothetical protein